MQHSITLTRYLPLLFIPLGACQSVEEQPTPGAVAPIEAAQSAGGHVSFHLIDAPADVKRLDVTARALRFRPCKGGGWETIDFPDKQVNLLDLVDGVFAELLDGGDMLPGEWCEGRLLLAPDALVVELDDSVHPLKIPSAETSGLKIKGTFEVVPGDVRTVVSIDFDVEKSLKKLGYGGYKLDPVIHIASVTYETLEGLALDGTYAGWSSFIVYPDKAEVFALPGDATIAFAVGAVAEPTPFTVTRWTDVPGAAGDLYDFTDHPTFAVPPVVRLPVDVDSPQVRIWLDAAEVLDTVLEDGFAVASVPHFSPLAPKDACAGLVKGYWCSGADARVLCDGAGSIVDDPVACTCTTVADANDRCEFDWPDAPWAAGECLHITGEYDQTTHGGIYALDVQHTTNCNFQYDLLCPFEKCRVETNCRTAPEYGDNVCVEELDAQDQASGRWQFVAHLAEVAVADAAIVGRGDKLGLMGNTGLVTNPKNVCQRIHFHMETAETQAMGGMLDDDNATAFPFAPAQFSAIVPFDRICAEQGQPWQPPPGDDCPDPGFADVKPGDWYFDYVRRLVCGGIVDAPTPDKPNFGPLLGSNRAEFLKFHLELAFPDVDFASLNYPLDYIDVSPDAWYAPYVAFATAQGIVEGYPGNLFKPQQTVNRAESAEMVVNMGAAPDFPASDAYEQLHADYLLLLAGGAVDGEFDDVSWDTLGCAQDVGYDDSCWFYHPVHALRDFKGAACGKGGNLFDPAAEVLRSETAKIACIVSGLCPAEECP